MPVPRRFDRRPPERDSTRINDRIRVPEVRLIDETGNQIGVMKTNDALRYAQERDLDLVEVAPEARPPVCRVLDYSKYKYEQAQKLKQARKHQQQITIREIKFRPKIAENDYKTKKGHVERFLRHKDKVKVTIMFRGREVTHPERGVMILDRLAEELAEVGSVEQRPIQDGRNMTMMLGPSKAVLSGELATGEHPHDAEVPADAEAVAGDAGADTPPPVEQEAPPVTQAAVTETRSDVPAVDPEVAPAAVQEPVAELPTAVAEAAVEAPAAAKKPPAAKPAAAKPAAPKATRSKNGAAAKAKADSPSSS
ncbi:MAG TPA: translation initiation factor IF-3 [Solirubrobacteraceae bacterium]|nr:translation initiation factor IF-3 [Solirubrobacteraceae bacterium]